MKVLASYKRGKEPAKAIVSTLGVSENLISFLKPAQDAKKEYLEAIDSTIEFFSP